MKKLLQTHPWPLLLFSVAAAAGILFLSLCYGLLSAAVGAFLMLFLLAFCVIWKLYRTVLRQKSQLAHTGSLLQENILKNLLQNEVPSGERLKKLLHQYDLHFSTEWFCVIITKVVDENTFLSRSSHTPDYALMEQIGLIRRQLCEQYLGSFPDFHVTNINGKQIILVNVEERDGQKPAQCVLEIDKAVSQMLVSLSEQYGLCYCAAISDPCHGVSALNYAFVQASGLLESVSECGCVVTSSSLGDVGVPSRTQIYRSELERKFYNYTVSGNYEKAGQILLQRTQADFSDPFFSFPSYKQDLLRCINFLTDSMGLSRQSATPQGRTLFEEYIAISQCFTQETLLSALDTFCTHLNAFLAEEKRSAKCKEEQIQDYIRQNYMDANLSAAAISQQFGISQAYLSRLIKQYFGMGVLDMIHKERISHIKPLLETDLRMEEIACRCGYYSQRTMSQAFRRYEGITPNDYRKSRTQLPTDA